MQRNELNSQHEKCEKFGCCKAKVVHGELFCGNSWQIGYRSTVFTDEFNELI